MAVNSGGFQRVFIRSSHSGGGFVLQVKAMQLVASLRLVFGSFPG